MMRTMDDGPADIHFGIRSLPCIQRNTSLGAVPLNWKQQVFGGLVYMYKGRGVTLMFDAQDWFGMLA